MSLTEYRVGDKAIWNQGRIYERERIIKLLEEQLGALSQIKTGHGKGSELMSIRTKTIQSAIALIKGGNNE